MKREEILAKLAAGELNVEEASRPGHGADPPRHGH